MAGPHQISFRPAATNVPLQASMTVTDGKWVLLPLYFELTCLKSYLFIISAIFYSSAWVATQLVFSLSFIS